MLECHWQLGFQFQRSLWQVCCPWWPFRQHDVRGMILQCMEPHGILWHKRLPHPKHPVYCKLEAGILPYVLKNLLSEISEKEKTACLDQLIQGFGELSRQNGSHCFPRLHWPDDVTPLVHSTCDQKTGKLFAVAMLSNTVPGKSFFLLPFLVVSSAGRIWMMCLKLFCDIGH